jgi:hypothetical protein
MSSRYTNYKQLELKALPEEQNGSPKRTTSTLAKNIKVKLFPSQNKSALLNGKFDSQSYCMFLFDEPLSLLCWTHWSGTT